MPKKLKKLKKISFDVSGTKKNLRSFRKILYPSSTTTSVHLISLLGEHCMK